MRSQDTPGSRHQCPQVGGVADRLAQLGLRPIQPRNGVLIVSVRRDRRRPVPRQQLEGHGDGDTSRRRVAEHFDDGAEIVANRRKS